MPVAAHPHGDHGSLSGSASGRNRLAQLPRHDRRPGRPVGGDRRGSQIREPGTDDLRTVRHGLSRHRMRRLVLGPGGRLAARVFLGLQPHDHRRRACSAPGMRWEAPRTPSRPVPSPKGRLAAKAACRYIDDGKGEGIVVSEQQTRTAQGTKSTSHWSTYQNLPQRDYRGDRSTRTTSTRVKRWTACRS